MSFSRNQTQLFDIQPTVDSIIKKIRGKIFTPTAILSRLLSESFPHLKRDGFNLFAAHGFSGTSEDNCVRQLLDILNKKSLDPNFSPLQAAIGFVNQNTEKLKSSRKVRLLLSAFFSVFEHLRQFLSADTQAYVAYHDVWQRDLTRQIDKLTSELREQRGGVREDTLNSLVLISNNAPTESKLIENVIVGIISHLEFPSVYIFHAIHRLKSRIPAERLPYVINKLWDARKDERSVVVSAGLEVLAGFIGMAREDKLLEIVAGLRNIVRAHSDADIKLSAIRCLMNCLKHLRLNVVSEVVELLLQRLTIDESMEVRKEISECIVTFADFIDISGLTPNIQNLLQLMQSNEVNKARHVPEILHHLYAIASQTDHELIVRALINVARNHNADAHVRQAALQMLVQLGDRVAQQFHRDITQCYLLCMESNNELVSKAACNGVNSRYDWIKKYGIPVPISALLESFLTTEDEQARLESIKKLSLLTKVLEHQHLSKVVNLIIDKMAAAQGAGQEDHILIYANALKNIFTDIPQKDYLLFIRRIFSIIVSADFSEKWRIGLAYFALQSFNDRAYDQTCFDVDGIPDFLANKETPEKLVPVMLEIISMVEGLPESCGDKLRQFALESLLSPNEQSRYYSYILLTSNFNRFATDDFAVINGYIGSIPDLSVAKKAELLVKFKNQISVGNFDRFLHAILAGFSGNNWFSEDVNTVGDVYQALHLCVPLMNQNQKIILLCQLIYLLANDQFQVELKPLFLHTYFSYQQDLVATLLQKSSITLNLDLPDEVIRSVMSFTT